MRIFGLVIEREARRVFATEVDAYDAGFTAGYDQAYDDALDRLYAIEDRRSQNDGLKAIVGMWKNGQRVA